MRMIPALCALAVSVGLSGCAAIPDLVSKDGVLCSLTPGAEHVVIQIAYGHDGMPSATPDHCTVYSDTHVTWSTTAADNRPFSLVFQSGDPGEVIAMVGASSALERGTKFSSKSEDGRQKVKIKARKVAADTRLKYDIEANGRKLDPDIIIKPR